VSNPDLEVLDVEVLGGLTREEAEGVVEGVERGLRGLHGVAVAVTPTDIKPPVKVRLPAVTKADELPIVLTIQEAAGVLRTSVGSMYQRISRGQLTKHDGLIRDGRKVLFHRDRLLRFLENGGRR
jgi:excisionase family DNA binding protein